MLDAAVSAECYLGAGNDDAQADAQCGAAISQPFTWESPVPADALKVYLVEMLRLCGSEDGTSHPGGGGSVEARTTARTLARTPTKPYSLRNL